MLRFTYTVCVEILNARNWLAEPSVRFHAVIRLINNLNFTYMKESVMNLLSLSNN
jgi:hypothetical protein